MVETGCKDESSYDLVTAHPVFREHSPKHQLVQDRAQIHTRRMLSGRGNFKDEWNHSGCTETCL